MSAGAVTLRDITSADWSLMIDSTAAAMNLTSGIGNVVQGVADVNQCLGIILATPRGADPLRPTFGADLWQYMDAPLSAAIPAIVREITEAITLWEPRIKLLAVTAKLAGNDLSANLNAHLNINLTWQLKLQSAAPQNVTITIPSRL